MVSHHLLYHRRFRSKYSNTWFLFICSVKHRTLTVVFEYSPRGFLVGGRKNDLVLLRATDTTVSGGHNYSVRLQASSLTSSVAILRAGAKKIYQMIEKFSSPAIHTIVPPPPSSKRFVTTPCE